MSISILVANKCWYWGTVMSSCHRLHVWLHMYFRQIDLRMKSLAQYYPNPTYNVKRITPNSFLVWCFSLFSWWKHHFEQPWGEKQIIVFFWAPKHFTGTYCDLSSVRLSLLRLQWQYLLCALPSTSTSLCIPTPTHFVCMLLCESSLPASPLFPFVHHCLHKSEFAKIQLAPPPIGLFTCCSPWPPRCLFILIHLYSVTHCHPRPARGVDVSFVLFFFSVTRLVSIRLLSYCYFFSLSTI